MPEVRSFLFDFEAATPCVATPRLDLQVADWGLGWISDLTKDHEVLRFRFDFMAGWGFEYDASIASLHPVFGFDCRLKTVDWILDLTAD